MDATIGFRIVGRGYDRDEVHAHIDRLVADRDSALSQAAGAPANGSPEPLRSSDDVVGFQLVRRGYDRAQVDDEINRLVGERDRARARAAAPGPHGGEPA